MRTMTNLEYHFVIAELAQGLENARLDKVYQIGEKEYRLKFRGKDVTAVLGERIHFTKYIKDAPEEPNQFVMLLRKYLENAKVAAVKQHEFDRVVEIDFEKGDEKLRLIFEMFAKGNLILVGADGKIITCYSNEEWSDRKTRRNEEYKFPKSPKVNLKAGLKELEKILQDAGTVYISSALIKNFPLGKQYVNELLARSNFEEKKPANSLREKEVEFLAENLQGMLWKLKPRIYLQEGKPAEYGLSEFGTRKELEEKSFASLSEALDEYYINAPVSEGESGEGAGFAKAKAKVMKKIEDQEKAVGELEKEASEAKSAGDKIYENYQKVEEILKKVKELRKMNKTPRQIAAEIREKGVEYDEKTGKVMVEF
ncbi:Uncharacterised protein [Candidatus Gugararchaeum adminiculabundum]|nr:Uncharacterised protein [Candidatus Gugararchaeum adminiculabundum]